MEKFSLDPDLDVWEAECDADCHYALMGILSDIQDETLEGAFTENFGIEASVDGRVSILVKVGSNGLDEAIDFLRTYGITIS
jgi:hypothetical protein